RFGLENDSVAPNFGKAHFASGPVDLVSHQEATNGSRLQRRLSWYYQQLIRAHKTQECHATSAVISWEALSVSYDGILHSRREST
ncbi:MAG: hypothetical protein IT190_10420, partial [Microbacteriaceae bacterium]|nr:hypothetical protein [Microbacteriaceae bacterium]